MCTPIYPMFWFCICEQDTHTCILQGVLFLPFQENAFFTLAFEIGRPSSLR